MQPGTPSNPFWQNLDRLCRPLPHDLLQTDHCVHSVQAGHSWTKNLESMAFTNKEFFRLNWDLLWQEASKLLASLKKNFCSRFGHNLIHFYSTQLCQNLKAIFFAEVYNLNLKLLTPVLQILTFWLSPGHPSKSGVWLMQVRFRICVPVPHDTLHRPKLVHKDHIGQAWRI